MELEVARKLISKYADAHTDFIQRAEIADRYYKKDNDIKYSKKQEESKEENPLHNADNRIPSNFFKMQVNQKTAYMFTNPIVFDVGNEEDNALIKSVLGDAFSKKCKLLCVQASKASVGWLHYWRDSKNQFKYAVINSKQIVPIWTRDLERNLLAVLRIYQDIDETTGYEYTIYEYWTDKEAQSFRRRVDLGWDYLEFYPQYSVYDVDAGITEYVDTYVHGFDEVPFIFFNNGEDGTNDLNDIKELIDSYDKIYSGFVNDLEDIQELIFIITNYGGEAESAKEILREMKDAKIIQVESDGPDDKSGISTLAIEVPVQARETLLKLTRNAIFEQGMAIDPDPQNFGNSSGVALNYLYSLLELKAGMMETEFRTSFNRFIRTILKFHNKQVTTIEQTWIRSSVSNDNELADIASKSKGIISDETIVKNHPWTTNAEKELNLLKKQKDEAGPQWDKVPVTRGGEGNAEE